MLSQGKLVTNAGEEHVVLKRVKARVEVSQGKRAGGGGHYLHGGPSATPVMQSCSSFGPGRLRA